MAKHKGGRRSAPEPGPVEVTITAWGRWRARNPAQVAYVLAAADGDARRIQVVDERTMVILNHPNGAARI